MQNLRSIDSALSFLADGYLFGTRRFDALQTDAFRTRLLGVPVVVMRGSDACRFFYEQGRFTRSAALPPSITHLLQDVGSVQTLEGADHRDRKHLFVDALMSREALDGLADAVEIEWMSAAADWAYRDRVSLSAEIPKILSRAILSWSGIESTPSGADERASEFVSMIENAARIGPPNWAARARRRRTEKWAGRLVVDARADPAASEGTVLGAVAAKTSRTGSPLPVEVAAVELINVLRPFVAISRFLLFAVLGLRRRPDLAEAFRSGDESLLEDFAQEVRRFYPFFPVIAGRASRPLEFDGHPIAAGSLVMLDLYGTDHDKGYWGDPEVFRPERFAEKGVDPNHLIAQGGGTYLDDHRCPGEPVTVRVIMRTVQILTQRMDYQLPPQDLRVSLRAFPAIPESGVLLSGVTVRA
ncbi:cytochrome P450 [Agreia sp. VKM Ac-1783]|uniref:cytochrome P450 n=1 Tax=Agreia sp. VKM Ac-1783 TaxID=1938889 RepID=UPI000A2AB3FA|nr:cytochrome P450 [Agreia sp. VKM Ac-1783]SMQ73835.1 fatty-acid peroxygenase [Agreia sp. VKM Ac-1783]